MNKLITAGLLVLILVGFKHAPETKNVESTIIGRILKSGEVIKNKGPIFYIDYINGKDIKLKLKDASGNILFSFYPPLRLVKIPVMPTQSIINDGTEPIFITGDFPPR